MIKKLVKHGNSLALIIDKPILELLKIDADTSLEISTDGKQLTIQPSRPNGGRRSVEDALAWVDENYAHTLKRLAK